MKASVVVWYAISIVSLWLLVEVLWGATGGAMAGLTIARDPAYQQKITEFLKQRGVAVSSGTEIRAAIARLSPEDRAALDGITRDAMKGSPIGGFGMTIFVSAAAFGIAGLMAGFFTQKWGYAWILLLASAALNNPLRRFALLAGMPMTQKVLVVIAQCGVCFAAAWLGSMIATRRDRTAGHPEAANA